MNLFPFPVWKTAPSFRLLRGILELKSSRRSSQAWNHFTRSSLSLSSVHKKGLEILALRALSEIFTLPKMGNWMMRTITSKEKDVERKDGSSPRVFRYISPPNALAVTFTKAPGSFISEDREDIRRLRRKGTKLRVHLTGSGGNRDTWTRNRQHEAGNFRK